MAIYAIGDVHGCHAQLRELLEALRFRPAQDRLIFVGDIINRGPDSLGVLERVRDLGDRAVTLMGNHEVRAVAGLMGYPSKEYTRYMTFLHDHPQADTLLAWLRSLPFWHRDEESGCGVTHAGIHPAWSLERAAERADALHQILADDARLAHLLQMPDKMLTVRDPGDTAPPFVRELFDLNIFTRIRLVSEQMDILWPGVARANPELPDPFQMPDENSPYRPWYSMGNWPCPLLYGHWAMAGLTLRPRTMGLDSGCVYGGRLTAMRLDHPERPVVQVGCPRYVTPGE